MPGRDKDLFGLTATVLLADTDTRTRTIIIERERGQWAIYYTSSQNFIITFSYSLA